MFQKKQTFENMNVRTLVFSKLLLLLSNCFVVFPLLILEKFVYFLLEILSIDSLENFAF